MGAIIEKPILKNLNAVVTYAKQRYENEFVWQDIVLNPAFKESFASYLDTKACSIQYNKHTSVITSRQGQYLFVDNEWFAIASYFVDFCTELITYREYYMKICMYLGKDPKTYAERLRAIPSVTDKNEFMSAASYILKRDFPGRGEYNVPVSYLWKFASDYNWWHGSKTVDRHDFYVSAVLNQLNIVNASHGYVADIVFAYASDYSLRKLVEDISGFTINADTKDYCPDKVEDESYAAAELTPVIPHSSHRSISISAASLERFRAKE